MSINGAQNCSISGINITGNCLNDNVGCNLNCYCNNVGCHINEGNIYIVGEAKIGDKPVKDVYVVGTDWDTFMKILQEKGELKDVVIENGQIVTDPKRQEEIKEQYKKQLEEQMKAFEENMEQFRENMKNLGPVLSDSIINHLRENVRLPKKVEKEPVGKDDKPKDDNEKVDNDDKKTENSKDEQQEIIGQGPVVDNGEAHQEAFDNLLSALEKDLNSEQFAAYSNLIEVLRKTPDGDPKKIVDLYNIMFKGEKEISATECLPPEFIITPLTEQIDNNASNNGEDPEHVNEVSAGKNDNEEDNKETENENEVEIGKPVNVSQSAEQDMAKQLIQQGKEILSNEEEKEHDVANELIEQGKRMVEENGKEIVEGVKNEINNVVPTSEENIKNTITEIVNNNKPGNTKELVNNAVNNGVKTLFS